MLCIYSISNHNRKLGTVTLSYVDVMKVDYLRALVNWKGKTYRDYALKLCEECGRSIQPFEGVLLYVTKSELPRDYKLLFETLCLADYMGEVDYTK